MPNNSAKQRNFYFALNYFSNYANNLTMKKCVEFLTENERETHPRETVYKGEENDGKKQR